MHLATEDIPILEKAYNAKYGRELIGKQLGQFHSDFELSYKDVNGKKQSCKQVESTELFAIAKKIYWDRLQGVQKDGDIAHGVHRRIKGIPASVLEAKCIRDHKERELPDDQLKFCTRDAYQNAFNLNAVTYDLLDVGGKHRKFSVEYSKNFEAKQRVKFLRDFSVVRKDETLGRTQTIKK